MATVKDKYDLSIEPGEQAALTNLLRQCESAGSDDLAARDGVSPQPTPAADLVVTKLACRGELVEVRNDSRDAVPLAGWRLRDAGGIHVFEFPSDRVLEPGEAVRVQSGHPSAYPRGTSLGWLSRHVWNNDGDTAQLVGPSGAVVSTQVCHELTP